MMFNKRWSDVAMPSQITLFGYTFSIICKCIQLYQFISLDLNVDV